jgi:hypothetical protein
LRRTIITRSHFITFIQSWRVKPAGLFLCFLLFLFLSCKDDAAFVGFPKPPRLTTQFVDIPVNPTVVLLKDVLTRNSETDPIKRFIIGKANDPQFGKMEAKAYASITPPVVLQIAPATAVFDSLVVQLQLDNYHYGSDAVTPQTIRVYEVLDSIKANTGYYSDSNPAISAAPLGEATFTVDPLTLDNARLASTGSDTSAYIFTTVRIKLAGTWGSSLLADLQQTPQTLLSDPDAFAAKYKGLAFVPVSGDKLLGIRPTFSTPTPKWKETMMSLYYTDTSTGLRTRADFLFYFSANQSFAISYPAISFTNITTDRSSTALSGIQPLQDFVPLDNQLYLQSGTALVTKLDLQQFYDYIDTVDNVVFNSAQLILTTTSHSAPPTYLQLKMLDATNHFLYPYYDTLVNDVLAKNTLPFLAKQPSAYALEQAVSGSTANVRIDGDEPIFVAPDTFTVGNIYITEFCQQAYRYKKDNRRIRYLALMPYTDELQKSVNGLVMDKNISIRLYYSKPIIKIR